MYSRTKTKTKCRTKNEALRNSSIKQILLWRLSIQNHLQPSITEKRRNKAKYLTWNSTRLKFVKKISTLNPVKNLGCIECHISSSPNLLKTLAILSDTTVRRSAVDPEALKPYWKPGSASMKESSGSQFFRTISGIQSGRDAFDKSRLIMTFLAILRVTKT